MVKIVRRQLLNWCKLLLSQTVLHAQNTASLSRNFHAVSMHGRTVIHFLIRWIFNWNENCVYSVGQRPAWPLTIGTFHLDAFTSKWECTQMWNCETGQQQQWLPPSKKKKIVINQFSSVWTFIRFKRMRRYQHKAISFGIMWRGIAADGSRKMTCTTNGRTHISFHHTRRGLVCFVEYSI